MYRNVSHPYIDGDCENVVSASMCDITKKPFVLRLNVMYWYLQMDVAMQKGDQKAYAYSCRTHSRVCLTPTWNVINEKSNRIGENLITSKNFF